MKTDILVSWKDSGASNSKRHAEVRLTKIFPKLNLFQLIQPSQLH